MAAEVGVLGGALGPAEVGVVVPGGAPAPAEVGVLGGGPGQMSPLRELLGLHPVVLNAESDPEFKLLARAAYNGYDFCATLMIIKALTLKEEDLRMVKEEHEARRAALLLRKMRIQYMIDGMDYEAAAPLRNQLELLRPSLSYHQGRSIYALRERRKIKHHLHQQYRNLERWS